jgi:hypothetical protein
VGKKMRLESIVKNIIAHVVASVVPGKVFRDKQYFQLWQSRGYHVTPVHFYEPLPDTRTPREDLWSKPSEMVGIDMNESRQLELLSLFSARYKSEYDPCEPNGTKMGIDWGVLYCMIRHFKPQRIIEIGSGRSTRVSAEAIRRNRQETGVEASLVAIDPYATQDLLVGVAGLAEVKRTPVQDVPLAEFAPLDENDILFIDSSHTLSIDSDVHYLFMEIIPRLRKGVLVHIHDIFFPYEYPRRWVMEWSMFWNEAYVLRAFLAFNSAFEVMWSSSYLHHHQAGSLKGAFSTYTYVPGGDSPSSFWMRRTC